MGDSLAIVTLALQYSVIVYASKTWLGFALPFSVVAALFLLLACIGLLLWRREKLSQTWKRWAILAGQSIILGIAFFGADFLIALANGKANPWHFPGGLLGMPVTLLVCPGGTIICLAGVVRAYYLRTATEASE